MQDKIGGTAGLVWRYLDGRTEPVSVIKIKTALGLPNSIIHLALGWLARENKISLEEKNNTIFVLLKR